MALSLADLDHALRPPAAEPVGAIILLHGPGATEHDPLALLEVLDPQRRFGAVCPRGTMNVPGAIGYQWYIDREPGYPQRDTFEQTYAVLDEWLGVFAKQTGIPPDRTVLGGFSQGAAMAWALAMGSGRPKAGGVLAVSGFIPRVSDLELDDALLEGLPVAICHGENDPKVPVGLAQTARDRAKEAGADVLYKESDVPHILDPRVIPEVATWLAALPRVAAS
jgi:phospholipase/carboxylesterase